MKKAVFESLNQHILEYYQDNKFIGKEICDGEVAESEIGYFNHTIVKAGQKKFKRIFTASESNPFKVVKYNLQGKFLR